MKQTFLEFGQLRRADPSPLGQETSFGLLLSEGAKEQTTTAGEAFPVFPLKETRLVFFVAISS